jgi:mitogen-activated protein kinase 1/3
MTSCRTSATPSTCSGLDDDLDRKYRRINHCIKGKEFVVDERYEDLKAIGQGAYGTVVSCVDTLTGKHLAIKKISDVFADPQIAQKILRELRLMRCISHPNILSIKNILEPLEEKFDDVYITSDLMYTDLYKVLRNRQVLPENHQRYIMYQVMCGLAHLHASHIIHRDLKPGNILLSLHCEVKICDFGLARMQSTDQRTEELTQYVVTRWYR